MYAIINLYESHFIMLPLLLFIMNSKIKIDYEYLTTVRKNINYNINTVRNLATCFTFVNNED